MLILMVQGFLIKSYIFEDETSFYRVLWMIAGAALAFLASLTLFRSTRPRRA